MKKLLAALVFVACPAGALADKNMPGQRLTLESGLDVLRGTFNSDKSADLTVLRYQPFFRAEYNYSRWVSNFIVVATEFTEMNYSQQLNDTYRIRLNLNSNANIFLAHGIKFHFLEYRNFRLEGLVQYEYALWNLNTDINSIEVIQGDEELDITDMAREHVSALYRWQRLHLGITANYDIWRFTLFVTCGWNVLDANITFRYDEEARETLAVLGYRTDGENNDHYRAGAAMGMIGTQFRIWETLSANLAGVAVPDDDGWVFAGRVSIIYTL